jgi:hypothetical protein
VSRRAVAVTRRIDLDCSPSTAIAAVQDITSIERTERKADAVEVRPTSDREGTYRVRGRFAGYPWTGEFAYTLHPTGFHSVNTAAMWPETRISGGFRVEPRAAGGCTVAHYERYVLTPWLVPLAPLIRLYLHATMRAELRALQEIVQRAGLFAGTTTAA